MLPSCITEFFNSVISLTSFLSDIYVALLVSRRDSYFSAIGSEFKNHLGTLRAAPVPKESLFGPWLRKIRKELEGTSTTGMPKATARELLNALDLAACQLRLLQTVAPSSSSSGGGKKKKSATATQSSGFPHGDPAVFQLHAWSLCGGDYVR